MFQDLIFKSIVNNADVTAVNFKQSLYSTITYALTTFGYSYDEISLLDFDIIREKNNFIVIGNNAITAFWLCGYYPPDVSVESMIINNNVKISYSTKSKKLEYSEI